MKNSLTLQKSLANFADMYFNFSMLNGSIVYSTDRLISELLAFRYRLRPSDNFPLPPPKWQSVHIGQGVFVKDENSELDCEVIW